MKTCLTKGRCVAVLLALTVTACAHPKDTGITMERTTAGNYQKIANCVRANLYGPNPDLIPNIIDHENEKYADVWVVVVGGILSGPSRGVNFQKIQQIGSDVHMTLYLPTIGVEPEKKYIGSIWDKCAPEQKVTQN